MKEETSHWLMQQGPNVYTLAIGVIFPDKSKVAQIFSEYSNDAMEKVWAKLTELMVTMRAHRMPIVRVRWVFASAMIHATIRADSTCLAVVTPRDLPTGGIETIETLMTEFRAM